MTERQKPKCGCGRSPTGYCIGWHSLSEKDYLKKKSDYDELDNEAEAEQD